MRNFILHSGNIRFPFFPSFFFLFFWKEVYCWDHWRKCKCTDCLLRLQEREHRQLVPHVFPGKWEIIVFECICSAKEGLCSLHRTVLEEIKFWLHLRITRTPAQILPSAQHPAQHSSTPAVLTNTKSQAVVQSPFFACFHLRKRQNYISALNRLPVLQQNPPEKLPAAWVRGTRNFQVKV